MTAKQPLYDVVIPLHMATQDDADKLARTLIYTDLHILAVMCDVIPSDTRWIITISMGVRAPDNLSAIIRAARFVRSCCRQHGFGAHMTGAGVTVGPSTL